MGNDNNASGQLKPRRSLGGYNKTDVEAYIEQLINGYERELEEHKRRFQNAMKTVEDKDEKCLSLMAQLAELKTQISVHEDDSTLLGESQANVTQLLADLETAKGEAAAAKAEAEAARAELSALQQEALQIQQELSAALIAASGMRVQQHELLKNIEQLKLQVSSLENQNAELRQAVFQAADGGNIAGLPDPEKAELTSQVEKAMASLTRTQARVQELEEKIGEAPDFAANTENGADRELLAECGRLLETVTELKKENGLLRERLEKIQSEGQQPPSYANLLADTVEQAGVIVRDARTEAEQIRQTARETADRMIESARAEADAAKLELDGIRDTLREIYDRAYDTVDRLRETVDGTTASVFTARDGLIAVLEDLAQKKQ